MWKVMPHSRPYFMASWSSIWVIIPSLIRIHHSDVDKKISKVAREKCSYLDFKKKKSFMKVNNNFKIRVIKYLGFNALYSHTRIHDDLPRASQRCTKSPPHFHLLGSMQKKVGVWVIPSSRQQWCKVTWSPLSKGKRSCSMTKLGGRDSQ